MFKLTENSNVLITKRGTWDRDISVMYLISWSRNKTKTLALVGHKFDCINERAAQVHIEPSINEE